MCGPATPPGPSYLDLETTVTDLRALLDAANEARERAEQVHSGCDAQVRALVTKALAAIRAQEAAESRAERMAKLLREAHPVVSHAANLMTGEMARAEAGRLANRIRAVLAEVGK